MKRPDGWSRRTSDWTSMCAIDARRSRLSARRLQPRITSVHRRSSVRCGGGSWRGPPASGMRSPFRTRESPGISEPLTAYARLKTPLDFAAPDRKRVFELYVILVPAEGAAEAHLQLLALVAEAFSDRAFRARLATASDPDDVRSTFGQWIRTKQAAR